MTRDPIDEDPRDALCRLCGSDDISFEHLPPSSAGNSTRAWMYGFESYLARDLLTGQPQGRATIQQRGSGAFSLCAKCNAQAGARYVPEFGRWVDYGWHVLRHLKPPLEEVDERTEDSHVQVTFAQTQGARVLKQVATMMLALAPAAFADAHPNLRAYARDPERVILPERYQFYVALYTGHTARYISPGSVVGMLFDGSGSFSNTCFGEISYPPFSFLISLDSDTPPAPTGCITRLAYRGIDERFDLEIPLLIGFGHTVMPGDFRTKAQVAEQAAANAAGRPLG